MRFEQARCRVARPPITAQLTEGLVPAIRRHHRTFSEQADPDSTEHSTTRSRTPGWSIPRRQSAIDPRRRTEQRSCEPGAHRPESHPYFSRSFLRLNGLLNAPRAIGFVLRAVSRQSIGIGRAHLVITTARPARATAALTMANLAQPIDLPRAHPVDARLQHDRHDRLL